MQASERPRNVEEAIGDCGIYEHGRWRPGRLPLDEETDAARRTDGFAWIGMQEPNADDIAAVAATFSLPALAVRWSSASSIWKPPVWTCGATRSSRTGRRWWRRPASRAAGSRMAWSVRPARYPFRALTVHGLRAADLADAPTIDDVVGDLVDLLSNRILVAHAAWVERAFLNRALRHTDSPRAGGHRHRCPAARLPARRRQYCQRAQP
jgi:hypothetical protein